MGTLTTAEAACLLNVSPTTLRLWQRQYAFPASARWWDGRRRFDADDVEALRAALEWGHAVAQAVRLARRSTAQTRQLPGGGLGGFCIDGESPIPAPEHRLSLNGRPVALTRLRIDTYGAPQPGRMQAQTQTPGVAYLTDPQSALTATRELPPRTPHLPLQRPPSPAD